MVFQIPIGNAFPLDKSGRPDFSAALERQKGYFQSGATLAPARRIEALKALYTAIERAETDIFEALEADLGKGEFESYMCEVGLTLSEISYLVKHTKKICAGQAGENAAFPIRREKLRAQVALWDRAGDEPLELSLSFDDGASGRRARRGKYRDFEAVGVFAQRLPRDSGAYRAHLSRRVRHRRHGRARGERQTAGNEIR